MGRGACWTLVPCDSQSGIVVPLVPLSARARAPCGAPRASHSLDASPLAAVPVEGHWLGTRSRSWSLRVNCPGLVECVYG